MTLPYAPYSVTVFGPGWLMLNYTNEALFRGATIAAVEVSLTADGFAPYPDPLVGDPSAQAAFAHFQTREAKLSPADCADLLERLSRRTPHEFLPHAIAVLREPDRAVRALAYDLLLQARRQGRLMAGSEALDVARAAVADHP